MGRPKGSTSSKTSKVVKKDVTTDESKLSTQPEKKIYCLKCGCGNQNNFYLSRDKFRAFFKKIPYCKDCIGEIYQFYLRKYKGNINLALYFLCRKIDFPYIHSAYEGALNNVRNPNANIKGEENIVSAYFKTFAFAEQNGWGSCFDDSQGENQIEGLSSYEEITKVKKHKKEKSEIDTEKYDIIEYDTDDLQQKWGLFPNDDLAYLESEYLDWNDKLNGISDKATEIMVKEVCLQCNEIRKDRETGINVEKKLKTLQELLKTSGLIEAQDDTSAIKSAGMLIDDIEFKRPIKTVDPELDDVDSMRDIIYGFAGSLFRAKGVENVYTEKFDEIYGKYSINIIDDLKNQKASDLELSLDGDIDGTK